MRPSRAKAKTGWTFRELLGLTGMRERTLRHYLGKGVVPRPPFKGTATRYQHVHLACLVAAWQLRARERLALAKIRTRLAALNIEEIVAIAVQGLPAGPLATALGVQVAPPSTGTAAGSSVVEGASPLVAPRWSRIELALGLELHVRDDANPNVLSLARRLRELCLAPAEAS